MELRARLRAPVGPGGHSGIDMTMMAATITAGVLQMMLAVRRRADRAAIIMMYIRGVAGVR